MEVVVDGIVYHLQSHGGISRLFSEILTRMCQADETINITLLMTGKSQQVLPQHPRIHLRSAPQIERFLRPSLIWRNLIKRLKERWLKSAISRTEGKIWHSTYYTMPEVWQGKIVVTVYDMIHELFPQLFKTVWAEHFRERKRRCILSADTVICISETTRRDVLSYYGIDSEKVTSISLGYSNIFKQMLTPASRVALPISEPFILYVGSRTRYKNFKQLLQAYSIWQHHRDVSLVVVGREWTPNEMESLRKFGIYNRVCLLDKADDETLCYLYNTAVAFILPSLYEGFGIPLLEAMACGCLVVASSIPSTIEVARDCPIYFDPGEVESLVLALDKALLEGRHSQRSIAGLHRVKDFSWERTAEQTLEMYRLLSNL